jgi:hypothetical protein
MILTILKPVGIVAGYTFGLLFLAQLAIRSHQKLSFGIVFVLASIGAYARVTHFFIF